MAVVTGAYTSMYSSAMFGQLWLRCDSQPLRMRPSGVHFRRRTYVSYKAMIEDSNNICTDSTVLCEIVKGPFTTAQIAKRGMGVAGSLDVTRILRSLLQPTETLELLQLFGQLHKSGEWETEPPSEFFLLFNRFLGLLSFLRIIIVDALHRDRQHVGNFIVFTFPVQT
jgi:hypothetical protein